MKNAYGYYIFLGSGDYHKPKELNSNWTSTWKFEEWDSFLKDIVKLQANTLMVYMNGHFLPYQSKLYPELIEKSHPNVESEFFSKVLTLAKSYGLKIILVFTTTGHAGKYLENHPEVGIQTRSSFVDLEMLLSPFPQEIRKAKNQKQQGNAQVGFGILCHNHPEARQYAFNLIKEALKLYDDYEGIALHPPESIYPCYCTYCAELFQLKYKKDLLKASQELARDFYVESYFNFQTNLENEIKSLKSKQLYTFTIPWLFEPSFEKIAARLSKDTILIEWDYNLSTTRVDQLKNRLTRYQKLGHHLWFMPTAGFGINQKHEFQEQLVKVQQQINLALEAKVEGIIHFVGPCITLTLEKTNFESVSAPAT